MLIELDPIGPDGQPTETTVICPTCQRVYRVPFSQRRSWRCACAMKAASIRMIAGVFHMSPDLLTLEVEYSECVPVNLDENGKPITIRELYAAQLDDIIKAIGPNNV